MLQKLNLRNSIFKTPYKSFSSNINSSLVKFDLISQNKDIGLITINNSHKRNALSLDVLNGMIAELQRIDRDFKSTNTPRVIIINSEGPVFSSGHDLKELHTFNEEKRKESFEKCSELMISLEKLNSIVIAEVQGLATAAGCQLAATCDLVVASSKAKFETPGVRIGLFCSTPSVALARAISQKRAMYMLLTGNQVNAKTAHEWGLVNEIVDVEDLDTLEKQKERVRQTSLKLAEHINGYSGAALSFGKRTFYSQLSQNRLEDSYDIAGKAMCANLNFADTKEGISAFIEKRKAIFNKLNKND
jgi:enoyl-CoA hydratase/carnithine racemase